MKYFNTLLLFALVSFFGVNAQNTYLTENFGGSYAHLESMSSNSSGWTHSGTGDFVHKIVSGSGASGSNCFGQLNVAGAATASYDVQLDANETY